MPLYWAGLWLAVNIAPGRPSEPGGEVQAVGAREADQDDVAALLADALGEGGDQGGAGRAHVVRDDDGAGAAVARGRPDDADEGGADLVGEVLVQLVGIRAAHVVGLDDRVEVSHPARLSSGRPHLPRVRRARRTLSRS